MCIYGCANSSCVNLIYWKLCHRENTLEVLISEKNVCWGLSRECDLVKFICIVKRCAWNADCNSVQSSTSFRSPPVTKVIVGFVMLELLAHMWKYCKTLSAFTVEIKKCLFPAGFKGSICLSTV